MLPEWLPSLMLPVNALAQCWIWRATNNCSKPPRTICAFARTELSNRMCPMKLHMANAMLADERPALVGREGVRLELPDPIFHLLVRVVRTMREGKC